MMKTLNRILERIKEFKISINLLALTSLGIQIGLLIFAFFQRPNFYLKDFPELDTKASIKKSCYLAMRSILNKKASKALFDKLLVEQMKEDDYKFFDFVGKEKIFDVVENKSKGHCTVILTDNLGDRFFSFHFEDSNNSDYIYGRYVSKIDDITYDELTEDRR